jgi:RNA polymerase sigma-70 factor, ECF subfamily
MEDLIERSYRPAYTLALRLLGNPEDAAEATQEAYVRMVRGLRRFRGEAGAFPTWLFRIVSNVCLTEMRRRSRRDLPVELELLEETSGPEDTEQLALSRVFRQELEQALQKLPETYRTVVVLRDVYGMSGEETGQLLGISAGAVKVRLHRARKRLRDELVLTFPEWGGSDDDERESA